MHLSFPLPTPPLAAPFGGIPWLSVDSGRTQVGVRAVAPATDRATTEPNRPHGRVHNNNIDLSSRSHHAACLCRQDLVPFDVAMDDATVGHNNSSCCHRRSVEAVVFAIVPAPRGGGVVILAPSQNVVILGWLVSRPARVFSDGAADLSSPTQPPARGVDGTDCCNAPTEWNPGAAAPPIRASLRYWIRLPGMVVECGGRQ